VTEAEWTECSDPARMLMHMSGLVSDETFRYFLVHCCRRVARLLRDSRAFDAIEVAESFARGIATRAELAAAQEAAEKAAHEAETAAKEAEKGICNALDAEYWRELGATAGATRAAAGVVAPRAEPVALQTAGKAADAASTDYNGPWEDGREEELAAQCTLLRELVEWPGLQISGELE
jgi:hypothetical protein